MLRNTFLRTLREYRLSILIWGGALAMVLAASTSSYTAFFFGSATNKAQQLRDLRQLADSFSIIFGKVYDLDTFGGFLTFRLFSLLPLVTGIFGFLVGSALIRGEEERGALDLLLSTPHSRAKILLEKWAALLVALLIISFMAWLSLTITVSQLGKDVQLEAWPTLVAFLGPLLLGVFFGTLALMLGQMFSRGLAMGITGGFLAATYLLNNIAGSYEKIEWLRYISPFYYDSQSKPLARSVGANWLTLTILGLACLPVLAAAIYMYLHRDHNSYFRLGWLKVRTLVRKPHTFSIWRSSSFMFALRSGLVSALIWGLSLSAYVVLMISVLPGIRDQILELLQSDLYKNFGFAIVPSNEGMVTILFLTNGIVIYAAYAITLVSQWSGEENTGRLELLLSTPQPRERLLLNRFGVALISAAVMVLITAIALWLTTLAVNVPIDAGRALGAFIGMWALMALIIGIGFVLVAFGPGWAIAATSGVVAFSYIGDLLGQLLRLPDWLINLSFFKQYGRPLVDGPNWTSLFIMLAVGLALVAGAVYRFRSRDIAK